MTMMCIGMSFRMKLPKHPFSLLFITLLKSQGKHKNRVSPHHQLLLSPPHGQHKQCRPCGIFIRADRQNYCPIRSRVLRKLLTSMLNCFYPAFFFFNILFLMLNGQAFWYILGILGDHIPPAFSFMMLNRQTSPKSNVFFQETSITPMNSHNNIRVCSFFSGNL